MLSIGGEGKYQLVQTDPRDVLPQAQRAVRRGGQTGHGRRPNVASTVNLVCPMTAASLSH